MTSESQQISPLLADVVSTNGSVVVRFVGELDLATADKARTTLRGVLEHSPASHLIVDLADLSFCDSSGLAVLTRIGTEAHDDGRLMSLRRPRDELRRIIAITGLGDVLPIEVDAAQPLGRGRDL